jgi:O-antigen ligase
MSFLRKKIYCHPLYLLYIFQLIIIGGVIFHTLPREIILSLAFLILLFLSLTKLKDALFFFLASVPFFVALPITNIFDSLNIWRLAILVLLGRFIFQRFPLKIWLHGDFLKTLPKRIWQRLRRNKIEFWTVVYLAISLLSILKAQDKIAALKRLIYIAQMISVYPLARGLLKKEKDLKKAVKFILISSLLVLIIGLAQLAFSYVTSLDYFWGWWAWRVEVTLYGKNLANIVSRANTWFSYYGGSFPRLRSFGTFTDSHSFALYLLLASPLLLWLGLKDYLEKRKISLRSFLLSIAFILMQFLVVLSGTRGIWISVISALGVALYFLLKRLKPFLVRYILGALGVFIILLPLSSFLLSIPQFSMPSSRSGGALTMRRFQSIIDFNEISNQGRLFIWQESLKSIAKNPLLGVGIGNFPVILEQDVLLQEAGSTAHNIYLNAGVEMGIFGILALGMVFYHIFKKGYLFIKVRAKNHFYYLPILLGFYFLWIAVYSLFDIAIFDARVMIIFVTLIAALNVLSKKYLDEKINIT